MKKHLYKPQAGAVDINVNAYANESCIDDMNWRCTRNRCGNAAGCGRNRGDNFIMSCGGNGSNFVAGCGGGGLNLAEGCGN